MVDAALSTSSTIVRTVHVFGMAIALGGAVLARGILHRFSQSETDADAESSIAVCRTYEWLFWGAIGLVVMTGVGNLGALAPAIPATDTRWGVTFTVKLGALLAFLFLSAARTLAVARMSIEFDERSSTPRIGHRLRVLYGTTAVYLAALLVIAEVLVRGF